MEYFLTPYFMHFDFGMLKSIKIDWHLMSQLLVICKKEKFESIWQIVL